MFWLICVQIFLTVFKNDWGRVDAFCKLETNLSEKSVEVFCNAFQVFHFFVSYANFFGEILLLNCFFSKSSFNHGSCFPYIIFVFDYFLNVFYCLKQSLIVFAFIFIFCHFLFLETSHTVVVYVSKVFLSQLLSSDFQYLLSFSFEKRHHKYKEI